MNIHKGIGSLNLKKIPYNKFLKKSRNISQTQHFSGTELIVQFRETWMAIVHGVPRVGHNNRATDTFIILQLVL